MHKVFVGMPGPWALDYSEPADPFTSKIGGLPDWPVPLEAIDPGLVDVECHACSSSLSLVSQVYAPINSGGLVIDERTIYVFGCVKPECGHTHLSWRAFRVQKLHDGNADNSNSQVQDPAESYAGQTTNFWDDDDDDNTNIEDLSEAFKNLATSIHQSSKQSAMKQQKIVKTKAKESPLNLQSRVGPSFAPVLPCFYTYFHDEPSFKAVDRSTCPPEENQIHIDDHKEEAWDKEDYEYDKALSADRTYLRYKKKIDSCPEQCFRYAYGGKPLVATETLHVPSPCHLCGAPRHFEMQLMPPLVYFLHEGSGKSPNFSVDNWNWMTLIVYTCSQNCNQLHNRDSSIIHGWTLATEEIELQLDDTAAISSPLLSTLPESV